MPDMETLEKICKTAEVAVFFGGFVCYGLVLYRAHKDQLPTRDNSNETKVQTLMRDAYELVTNKPYKTK
jgi:hypothetical protein